MGDQGKQLLPFLQRAEEMDKADPKVAYYCRYYAVSEGLKIENRSSELTDMLGSIMNKLESTKEAANLSDDDELYMENFALKIFAKADKLDRSGKSDAKTAKMFYVSSIFIEVLNQFNEINEDMASKQRYAAWRAGDLNSAAREGRAPDPPPDTSADGSAGVPGDVGDGMPDQRPPPGVGGPPPGIGIAGPPPGVGGPPLGVGGPPPGVGGPPPGVGGPPPGIVGPPHGVGGPPPGVSGAPPPPSYLAGPPAGIGAPPPGVPGAPPGGGVQPPVLPAYAPAPLQSHPLNAPPPQPSQSAAPPLSAQPQHPYFPGGYNPHANYPPPAPPQGVPLAEPVNMSHIVEAQKHAKYAASALGFEDVSNGIEHIQKALALLTGQLHPQTH